MICMKASVNKFLFNHKKYGLRYFGLESATGIRLMSLVYRVAKKIIKMRDGEAYLKYHNFLKRRAYQKYSVTVFMAKLANRDVVFYEKLRKDSKKMGLTDEEIDNIIPRSYRLKS